MPVTSPFVRALTLYATVLAAPLFAQDPSRAADHRVEPQLFVDADRLAADGVLREKHLVLPALRVVIELDRQPGDVTFETSTADDPVADVLASVIRRQGEFADRLDRTLAPELRAGITILFPLEYQYMLAAEVRDAASLRALAAVPGVAYVWKDNVNELHTTQGRTLTGSTAQANLGWTGAGVGVAVIDGRFDLLHVELGGSTTLPNSVIKAGENFSNPGNPIHSQSFNSCYHGTATASIVHRYAPAASLYALVVFPNSFDSVIANAINWCVTNKNGAGGGSPIRVISMSLGGGRYFAPVNSGTLHSACASALANDILCCASSGNDGWTDSMGSPAASSSCISIGASWDANGAPYFPFAPTNCTDSNRQVDERTCYSDTASFLSFYCPSEQVIAAECGGTTFEFGGTSAACPAGAALIAQLLHARPQYVGDRAGVISLFQSTGVSVVGDTSKRRVDLTAAINQAAPYNLRFTSLTTSGVAQQPGATMTITPTVINDGPQGIGTFQVEFFLGTTTTWSQSDIYLGSTSQLFLLAGQSVALPTQVTLPWRVQPQLYYVHAVADRIGTWTEWNEADNTSFAGMIGQAGPCVTKLEYTDPLLKSDANAQLSVTTGGAVHPMVVVPCVDELATLYMIVWGASGTSPGLALTPSVTVPINPDSFTVLGLDALNGAVLQGFLGIFSPQGLAQAAFVLPPSSGLPGTQTHFAALLIGGVDFWQAASNPLGLLLTP
ncbi:MAG: S8 family serine peptidase [Planctomycetes bacterium]|nr:S8 family serine peptidase [Planctomycetota bacterium]